MKATFSGGPYDGVVLDHNDITLYTRFTPIGIRKFVFLWPQERNGMLCVVVKWRRTGRSTETVLSTNWCVRRTESRADTTQMAASSLTLSLGASKPATGRRFKTSQFGPRMVV
jgi:hypothetical protein